MKEKIKQYLGQGWQFAKNSFGHLWTMISRVLADLTAPGNTGGRLSVFIAIYLIFSLIGAYNFAHLAAFIYIIWLLEHQG
jgi:hypothetical protein